MIDAQQNFSHVLARCSFNDENGNIRTMQGYIMIETSTVSYAPGMLVKEDFQLQGNGKLDIFDGLVPCPSAMTAINFTGLTASDGIVHVTYTYTGSIYQVKWRVDATGDYIYSIADIALDIPSALGAHTIEIIPVCTNGYEGTGMSQSYTVTLSLTCSSVITAINVNTSTKQITNTYTGTATQMQYRIDGGAWITSLINATISIAGLSVGAHTIEEIPLCTVGGSQVAGAGMTQAFSIASQPAQSGLSYNVHNSTPNSEILQIFVNGTLMVNSSANAASGNLTAPTGATVKVVYMISGTAVQNINLSIGDTTTGTSLYNNSGFFANQTFQYSWTANGDDYSITGAIIV